MRPGGRIDHAGQARGKDRLLVHANTSPERLATVVDGIPFKPIGSPEEVAKLVVLLSSDESSYTAGAAVNIHGGELII